MGRRLGKAWLVVVAGLALGFVVVRDVRPPDQVAWEESQLDSWPVALARDLVLQEQRGDEVWATLGYSIYRSRGGAAFERVHTVWPEAGEAWGGFSRTLRDHFRYQELTEVVPLRDDLLLVFAGGRVHRVDLRTGEDRVVHRLRYFGRGEGRGVMPHGIAVDRSGVVYYGEYPTRRMGPEDSVRVWRSADEGRTWQVAHEFAPFEVRHVHAVRWDPFAQALWVGTGDRDAESRVGYSTDGGRSFHWVGRGDQAFRTCSLMFSEEAVTWVIDSPRVSAGVVRWDRASGSIQRSTTSFGTPGYYTQSVGPGAGLATAGEKRASVWRVHDGEEPQRLFEWAVEWDPSLPHPVVRLARGEGDGGTFVYLNPLRTERDDAAIYRVPTHVALAPTFRVAARAGLPPAP